ncbi:MAG: alanine racemase C-terminal domain-containing protein, partial [Nocardioides sp.]
AGLDTRLLHLAASAATLHDPAARLSCSRVGAGLVGIDPAGIALLDQPLTLRSRLVSTHRAAAGTGVGYGSTWSAPSDTVLGLIPLGYADGLPRAASNRAEVVVGGRRCPVVGRISMDQTVVDLGPAGAPLGATVTVFGPASTGAPSVADWARWCETIPHEIVTGIGPRVTRVVHPVVDERVDEWVAQRVDQPVDERRDVVGS